MTSTLDFIGKENYSIVKVVLNTKFKKCINGKFSKKTWEIRMIKKYTMLGTI